MSPFGVKSAHELNQVDRRSLQRFVPAASQAVTSCQELDSSSYGYMLINPTRNEDVKFVDEGWTNPNMEECSKVAYSGDFCILTDKQEFTLLCSAQFIGVVLKDEAQYQSQILTSPLLGISDLSTTKDENGANHYLESVEVCLIPLQCPSAAPSATPSLAPTIAPSSNPTTTPYPTGGPSSMPSETPSLIPTASPSSTPTLSRSPTQTPSESPSGEPSATPTVSTAPSFTPSSEPTLSQMPSSSPTYIDQTSATFSVLLKLPFYLNSTQIRAFEEATEEWAENQINLKGGGLSSIDVTVDDQILRDLDGSGGTNRQLIEDRLEVKFSMDSTYTGSDTNFDLFTTLNPVFQSHDEVWIRSLGNKDDVFLALRNEPAELENLEANESTAKELSIAGKSGIVVMTFCAALITVIASIFAVRNHRLMQRGSSLRDSVGQNPDMKIQHTFSSESARSNDQDQTNRKISIPAEESKEEQTSLALFPKQAELPLPISPNTMERGDGRDSQEIFRVRSGSNLDQNSATPQDPPTKAGWNVKKSLVDDASEMSESMSSRPPLNPNQNRRSTFGLSEVQFSEADFESSRGATTLGGPTVNSTTGATNMTAQAKSIFNKMMGIQEEEEIPPNNLTKNIYDFEISGIYDVFAPPGPIGIIVDTTKDGPSVHSLKQNSPMTGLINPGDLLIGLDDMDTRGMTAATLTKLMAEKANQRERKITLLERK